MSRVQIKVLRCEFYGDLAETYLTEGRAAGPCSLHRPGQTYLYEGGAEKPEGLCPWAWITLYQAVSAVAANAENTWYRPGARVECCTDGIRPVVFEVAPLDGAAAE